MTGPIVIRVTIDGLVPDDCIGRMLYGRKPRELKSILRATKPLSGALRACSVAMAGSEVRADYGRFDVVARFGSPDWMVENARAFAAAYAGKRGVITELSHREWLDSLQEAER